MSVEISLVKTLCSKHTPKSCLRAWVRDQTLNHTRKSSLSLRHNTKLIGEKYIKTYRTNFISEKDIIRYRTNII